MTIMMSRRSFRLLFSANTACIKQGDKNSTHESFWRRHDHVTVILIQSESEEISLLHWWWFFECIRLSLGRRYNSQDCKTLVGPKSIDILNWIHGPESIKNYKRRKTPVTGSWIDKRLFDTILNFLGQIFINQSIPDQKQFWTKSITTRYETNISVNKFPYYFTMPWPGLRRSSTSSPSWISKFLVSVLSLLLCIPEACPLTTKTMNENKDVRDN